MSKTSEAKNNRTLQMLEDFGMSAPKSPGKRSAETTAEAVVKGRATKKARKEALESPTTVPGSQSSQVSTTSSATK